MKRDPWCPEDLTLEVKPPLVLLERSAGNTERAIAQFADQARYVKRDYDGIPGDETFCNVFVRETLRAQGVEIPRMRANDLVEHFTATQPWETVRPWVAQILVRAGIPIVVGWRNPTGRTGHVARLVAPRIGDDPNGWYIAQAGVTNFVYGTLGAGFGARPTQFFAHP